MCSSYYLHALISVPLERHETTLLHTTIPWSDYSGGVIKGVLQTGVTQFGTPGHVVRSERTRIGEYLLGNRSLRMEVKENRKTEDPVPIRPDRLEGTHM